ncbi:MAG TPA: 1,6-anhydro-N-acetylmuramyl-L-alanine amidase AmpD [Steroidobacteraceae bacterium]|nr:1,6-anhydro-N-acetylmuramyl-L-alanine amidase AmpD [Steroidobacteraceae bacterium]
MKGIAISAGLLAAARRVTSPNADLRPPGFAPELIVIHGISLPPGRYGGPWIDRLFTNSLPAEADPYFATIQQLRVSSHVLIDREGRVTQYVPFHERAWHAGPSWWRGRANCNDFSIGIELEGTDEEPYDDRQYAALVPLIAALQDSYPALAEGWIAGHSDIAPGRKTDPGRAFDWGRLERGLRQAGANFRREVLA